MRRCLTLAAIGAALVLPGTAGAGDPNPPIVISDNEFTPETVGPVTFGLQPMTYEWERELTSTNPHNVRQDDRLFRSGDPVGPPGPTFSRSFSGGTFNYYCEQHGQAMDGVIKVRPDVFPDNHGGDPFEVRWASLESNVGQAFDVHFMVEGSDRWRIWRNDTQTRQGVFGNNDRPVTVRSFRTYWFRVRTEKSVDQPDRKSDWSPIARADP